jgi:hypothetical protein
VPTVSSRRASPGRGSSPGRSRPTYARPFTAACRECRERTRASLGGDFVIAPDQTLVYAHPSREPADRPRSMSCWLRCAATQRCPAVDQAIGRGPPLHVRGIALNGPDQAEGGVPGYGAQAQAPRRRRRITRARLIGTAAMTAGIQRNSKDPRIAPKAPPATSAAVTETKRHGRQVTTTATGTNQGFIGIGTGSFTRCNRS